MKSLQLRKNLETHDYLTKDEDQATGNEEAKPSIDEGNKKETTGTGIAHYIQKFRTGCHCVWNALRGVSANLGDATSRSSGSKEDPQEPVTTGQEEVNQESIDSGSAAREDTKQSNRKRKMTSASSRPKKKVAGHSANLNAGGSNTKNDPPVTPNNNKIDPPETAGMATSTTCTIVAPPHSVVVGDAHCNHSNDKNHKRDLPHAPTPPEAVVVRRATTTTSVTSPPVLVFARGVNNDCRWHAPEDQDGESKKKSARLEIAKEALPETPALASTKDAAMSEAEKWHEFSCSRRSPVARAPRNVGQRIEVPAAIVTGIFCQAITDSALQSGANHYPSSNNNTQRSKEAILPSQYCDCENDDEKSELGEKKPRAAALGGNNSAIDKVQMAAILKGVDHCLRYRAGGIDCDFFRFKGRDKSGSLQHVTTTQIKEAWLQNVQQPCNNGGIHERQMAAILRGVDSILTFGRGGLGTFTAIKGRDTSGALRKLTPKQIQEAWEQFLAEQKW
ncbi:expressed unknown protein [Seminavis robusta]|uniref:Uncharacterized protein n=1 Tax=Seminavis robusta TaxID=568900 RepID=A0A9N8EEA2_9STRA|nr:expressed unknown protein [Seminavis robusta]|eukprot:Sro1054_g236000.1 n/a (504) ;mRNA; f:31103-32678